MNSAPVNKMEINDEQLKTNEKERTKRFYPN